MSNDNLGDSREFTVVPAFTAVRLWIVFTFDGNLGRGVVAFSHARLWPGTPSMDTEYVQEDAVGVLEGPFYIENIGVSHGHEQVDIRFETVSINDRLLAIEKDPEANPVSFFGEEEFLELGQAMINMNWEITEEAVWIPHVSGDPRTFGTDCFDHDED